MIQHGSRICCRAIFLSRQVKCKSILFSQVRNTSQSVAGEDVKWPPRVLSGIQPTGPLHLGNYLGAVKKWVEMQETYESTIFSIVDLHSITVPQDPDTLRQNILHMAASLIACGIKPEKAILFQQSRVYQHTQLCWLLCSLTTMAKLGQQTQLKEKRSVVKELSAALYMYPVLQAADILLYRATHVPVGEDQVSHLQLAVFLARTFNKRFGPGLAIPKAVINEDASSRVKNLRKPDKKMSKSDPDPKSRINLCDTPDQIRLKCRKAVTDFTSAVTYEPETRPGVSNLVLIHSLLTNKSIKQICQEAEDIETEEYKRRMADEIIEALKPIRVKTNELLSDRSYLCALLESGAQRAEIISDQVWQDIRSRVGLQPDYENVHMAFNVQKL